MSTAAERAGNAGSDTRAVFLDLEGTLRWGGRAIPSAADAVDSLRSAGFSLRLLTNIDSKAPETIQRSLAALDIHFGVEEIFTPVVALDRMLSADPAARCFFLLSRELQSRFSAHALVEGSTHAEADSTPDWVVVGDFRDSCSYAALNQAYRYLLAGSRLLALQRQPYFMGRDGPYLDTGSFVQLLGYAAGVKARVLGKPSLEFFRLALQDVGLPASAVVMIGDDLVTDVAGAAQTGMRTMLVRTGKYTGEPVATAAVQPTWTVASVGDALSLLAPGLR